MFTSLFKDIFCSGSRKPVKSDDVKRLPERITSPKSKYLVLDLDDTLVHCKPEAFETSDLVVDFKGMKRKYWLSKRPHLETFFEQMSKHYSIVIYTASSKQYATWVLDQLKIIKYVKRLFHRKHLVDSWQGYLTKDLSLLGVPMKDVILIDDCLQNSYLCPTNFLQIEAYEGNKDDRALMNLIPFLEDLSQKDDVRNVGMRHREFFKNLNLVISPKMPILAPLDPKPLKSSDAEKAIEQVESEEIVSAFN